MLIFLHFPGRVTDKLVPVVTESYNSIGWNEFNVLHTQKCVCLCKRVILGSRPLCIYLWTHWFHILNCGWWSALQATSISHLVRKDSSASNPNVFREQRILIRGRYRFILYHQLTVWNPETSLFAQYPVKGSSRRTCTRKVKELWKV